MTSTGKKLSDLHTYTQLYPKIVFRTELTVICFAFFFFLPFLIVFRRNLCVLIQQGVRHQLEGSLSVGHDLLHGLELFLDRVNGGVFSHDVPVVGRVWPTHARLEGRTIKLTTRINVNTQDTQ